jgi:hypothetical protein
MDLLGELGVIERPQVEFAIRWFSHRGQLRFDPWVGCYAAGPGGTGRFATTACPRATWGLRIGMRFRVRGV